MKRIAFSLLFGGVYAGVHWAARAMGFEAATDPSSVLIIASFAFCVGYGFGEIPDA